MKDEFCKSTHTALAGIVKLQKIIQHELESNGIKGGKDRYSSIGGVKSGIHNNKHNNNNNNNNSNSNNSRVKNNDCIDSVIASITKEIHEMNLLWTQLRLSNNRSNNNAAVTQLLDVEIENRLKLKEMKLNLINDELNEFKNSYQDILTFFTDEESSIEKMKNELSKASLDNFTLKQRNMYLIRIARFEYIKMLEKRHNNNNNNSMNDDESNEESKHEIEVKDSTSNKNSNKNNNPTGDRRKSNDEAGLGRLMSRSRSKSRSISPSRSTLRSRSGVNKMRVIIRAVEETTRMITRARTRTKKRTKTGTRSDYQHPNGQQRLIMILIVAAIIMIIKLMIRIMITVIRKNQMIC